MSSKDSQDFETDLNYLIDCELNQTNDTKTDKIRSKIFQLNATKDQFNSQTAFDSRRFELLTELNEELDKTVGKNTYITEELMDWAENGRDDRPVADFKSDLYELNSRQICDKLGLKHVIEDSDDCHIVGVVLKKPEDIEILSQKSGNNQKNMKRKSNTSSAANDLKSAEVVPNCTKNPAKPLFNKLGSFSGGFSKQQNSPKKDLNSVLNSKPVNSSPNPKVSGIFRTNNSPKINKIGNKSGNSEEIVPKKQFISGFEKKLVEDVKSGSMDISAARNVLKQVKRSFRPPVRDQQNGTEEELEIDPNLKNIDKHIIESIENEIITKLDPIGWEDVAGLSYAKKKIKEIAILPLLKPHLFTGLRKPPKGILLFGPPGTGKTFLGRLIASQTKSTFFSITVSTLNSKWIGEGEKAIKAMFAVARSRQPSVIFIDEIDSLLTTRSDTEHESSRRMKTEFLAQFEGVNTASVDKILIIGATNRPQDLDDAARRRLSARLYIRLPDLTARIQIIKNNLKNENNLLTEEQIQTLAERTEGYSGADMRELCRESAMESIRDMDLFEDDSESQIRDITFDDFVNNLNKVKPTVKPEDLKQYEEWDQLFGINDNSK